MKKLIGLFAVAALALTSCTDNTSNYYLDCDFDGTTAKESELDSIQSYLTKNEITANFDDRGFYYKIYAAGEELHPTRCYTLNADYKVYNFNGAYIDNGTEVSMRMHKLITGFQYGASLIGVGGTIQLFLPPSLAYGTTGSAPAIGSNEYLIFEIKINSLTFNNIDN